MTCRCLFFASLRNLVGENEVELELPEGARVEDVLQRLEGRFPRLRDYTRKFQVAVNEELAQNDELVPPGAEIALLPAVSGGSEDLVYLGPEPISLDQIYNAVRRKDCGGVVLFLGTVRDSHEGQPVESIEYNAYESMARKEMLKIVQDTRAKHPVTAVALVHRTGRVAAGEASVALAVASKHRAEAFEAARHIIDTLKQTVPLWKKEIGPAGEVWIEGDARVNIG